MDASSSYIHTDRNHVPLVRQDMMIPPPRKNLRDVLDAGRNSLKRVTAGTRELGHRAKEAPTESLAIAFAVGVVASILFARR